MRSLNQLSLRYLGPSDSFVNRYRQLPQVSSLTVSWWPEEDLAMIGTEFLLTSLSIFGMDLRDLSSFEFVKSVAELRIERTNLSSFAGIERWRESLKKVSLISYGPTGNMLDDLRAAMPHVTVSP
jgi:hypothetical protein